MMIPTWRGTGESTGEESVPISPSGGYAATSPLRGEDGSRRLRRHLPTRWGGRVQAATPPPPHSVGRTSRLDLHHPVLFPAGQSVHPLDLRFGDLLQPRRRPLRLGFGDAALLLHVLDPVKLVAAHVADRHAGVLRLLLDPAD